MGIKLLILVISALVCCDARSLDPPECQLNKFLLAYYGICPIDQSETGICIDMCTGELIMEEYHCSTNPECCWDGQLCTFKQIQNIEVKMENPHKLLSRLRRQTTATGGAERGSDGRWSAGGSVEHKFPSGSGSVSGSASYTQGHPGPQLGAAFKKNLPSGQGSIGGSASYMPGSRQPPSFGASYNRNLWGGQLSGSVNHTPGRSTSYGLSFSKRFGK